MNWGNVLPILSILVLILVGLWAIMRNIKEEIRSVKIDLDHKIDRLDHKIDVTKAELKEDIKVVRADIRSLQEMLWVSIVGQKPEFYKQPKDQQQNEKI